MPKFGDAGEILDTRTKAAYQDRLRELQEQIEEAETWNDHGRAGRLREEREFLMAELAGAVGLGGRDRKAASASERARFAVTKAIRSAVDRIEQAHPSVGRHLRATVRTGVSCSYAPGPDERLSWDT